MDNRPYQYTIFSLRHLLYTFLASTLAFTLCTAAQKVRLGNEILVEKQISLLKNKKVGIICNQSSLLPNGVRLVDTLLKLNIRVTALFSPEHGIRGSSPAGEEVNDTTDTKTKLPVYSLYGKTRKPTAKMLKDVDILLFDLQDAGARCYTYVSTLMYAAEAAAEFKKKFIVLDRPNPINGISIEGPILDTALKSFIGLIPIPMRYGLTPGELTKMAVGEKWLPKNMNLDLTVIKMKGWKRGMWYDETGLTWIPLSPNMKTLQTAITYPGTSLFEATNISEGRGTEKPFEYLGAPWINGGSLAEKLNKLGLPGVLFKAIRFFPKPDSVATPHPKYNGKECGGVFIYVTDRKKYFPVKTALTILSAIKTLYPDSMKIQEKNFRWLAGTSNADKEFVQPLNSFLMENIFKEDEIKFGRMREKYLIY